MADGGATVIAACVQMRSGVDRAQNTADALSLIRQAADEGAGFIATPEMTNQLDRDGKRFFENAASEEALEEKEAFAAVAAERKVWLLIGSMAVRVGERRAANRSFLFAPDGRCVTRYDKIHMFDVDLPSGERWQESSVYEAGGGAPVVRTPFGGVGLSICYDVRFAPLYRKMAQAGAEILCVPAAFTRSTGKAHWELLLRARAVENGAFVIAPAQGGDHADGRKTWGHSCIIGPWGDILAAADGDEPGVILAEIDLEKAREARRSIPNLALEMPYEILNVE